VVIDTSLYIQWYKGQNELVYRMSQHAVCYLSTIVLTELLAGANTEAKRRDVDRKKRIFSNLDRILVPDESISTKAGNTIQVMGEKSKNILGDVLIAMSAKAIGAFVWTVDKDFERIKQAHDFNLKVFEVQ